MKVVEIFNSIDGEGIRTGMPCSFIRLAGCNLRCSYCDTTYALFGEKEECKYTEMTIDEIVSKLHPRYKRITLTGGEPLIHPDCDKLINRLIRENYEVNVETNGAVDIVKFCKTVLRSNKLFFTVDYKLPSSGVCDKMIWNNFVSLNERDVIKFVVGSDEDLKMMKKIMERLTFFYEDIPTAFAGVVFGEFEPIKLVEAILEEPILKDVRYQIQLHKQIWNPDKRGV